MSVEYVGKLLDKMIDPKLPIAKKREIWHMWQQFFYSGDAVQEFLGDALFSADAPNYLQAMLSSDYKNFYELVMTLDLYNIDPRAYYLYWILTYGNSPLSESYLKEAMEYDPDTVISVFPCVREVVLNEETGK
jgi:hypothetical protein